MKKFLIISLFLSLFSNAHSEQKIFFKTHINKISKTSKSGYSVDINIKYKGVIKEFFQDSKVLMIYERYLISGKLNNNRITEYNFLYSQMNYDLNGDNDFDDSYTLIKKGKKFYLNRTEIKAILSKYLYNNFSIFNYYDNNKLLLNKINAAAKPFALYSINWSSKTVVFGLGTEKYPLKIIEFPNPNIQVLVIKRIENISQNPAYLILNEKNYTTLSNKKVFENQAGDWVAIVWAIKSIDINSNGLSKVNFIVKGIEPPFAVIAFANISLAKGIRLRSSPSFKIFTKNNQ